MHATQKGLPKLHSHHPPNHRPRRRRGRFKRILGRLEALDPNALVTLNVDAQAAAIAALGVAELVTTPAVHTRFANLAKSGEFDITAVDTLADVALAAWYARHKYMLASATSTEAQLPAALVREASERRERMLKLVEYHLGDDEEEGPRVAAVRAGAGHLDLANDLVALVELCGKHDSTLRLDKKHYRADDADKARANAGRILRLLGSQQTPEAERWLNLQSRSWTLLLTVYDEVQRGGVFLFHNQQPERKFPSLVTAARKAAAAGTTTDSTPANPPATP